MREESRSHRALAKLATAQYGVVSAAQLQELGYSTSAIARAAKSGRLHRVHRGVYLVGHTRTSPHSRCLAAVLAGGDGTVLSHACAGWLWGLLPAPRGAIHVTVNGRRRSRRGLAIHHARDLAEEDRATREGIPVTALARTLLDLAATAQRNRLARAIERSEQLGHFDLRAVEALMARTRGHHGAGPLREALQAYRTPAFTRSGLERRFLKLIADAGLPCPSTNLFVAGYELDAYWPAERFAVELDTYDYHGGHASFEADRLRQEDLKLAGIEMTRITGARLAREPKAVADRLARLLLQRRQEIRSLSLEAAKRS